MSKEPDEELNDPFDDEFDAAILAATELVSRTKTVGLAELEIPILDESCVWKVTVTKMGISDPG
jgi:hypothetical protein